MPNHEPLSRSGMTGRTGVPNDVLTYWVRYELVRPIVAPSGVGRHLRFHWYEANIAAVMNQLRILGVRIEGMLSIARVYRDAIAFFDGFDLDFDQVHALWSLYNTEVGFITSRLRRMQMRDLVQSPGFEPAKNVAAVRIAEETDQELEAKFTQSLVALSDEKHGSMQLTPELLELSESIDRDEFYRHIDAFHTIAQQPEPDMPGYGSTDELTFFWRVGEGDDYRFAWGQSAAEKAYKDGAVAMIAIDVTNILHKVWNPPAPDGDEVK